MSNIIISGANEGIGYYMAKQLLADGSIVHVLDINTDNIAELKAGYPDRIFIYQCDISDNKQVNEVFVGIENIDIVVHNACKCTFDSMIDTDIDTYREVINVNYFGAVNMAKAAIQKMKKGRIMFVSSGVAIMGFKNLSPYASSKNAIEALAKCLNLEYIDTPISFHIIHPTLTRTTSASPLPIPKEFMESPEKVGIGIVKNINKNRFIICHSFLQRVQTKMIYLFPLKFGRFFSRLTDGYAE